MYSRSTESAIEHSEAGGSPALHLSRQVLSGSNPSIWLNLATQQQPEVKQIEIDAPGLVHFSDGSYSVGPTDLCDSGNHQTSRRDEPSSHPEFEAAANANIPRTYALEQCIVHGGRRLHTEATLFVLGRPGSSQLDFQVTNVRVRMDSLQDYAAPSFSTTGTSAKDTLDTTSGKLTTPKDTASTGNVATASSPNASDVGALNSTSPSIADLQESDLEWPVAVEAGIFLNAFPCPKDSSEAEPQSVEGASRHPSEQWQDAAPAARGCSTSGSATEDGLLRYFSYSANHARVQHGRNTHVKGFSVQNSVAQPRWPEMEVAYDEQFEIADEEELQVRSVHRIVTFCRSVGAKWYSLK